jgi:hypothetical protein
MLVRQLDQRTLLAGQCGSNRLFEIHDVHPGRAPKRRRSLND